MKEKNQINYFAPMFEVLLKRVIIIFYAFPSDRESVCWCPPPFVRHFFIWGAKRRRKKWLHPCFFFANVGILNIYISKKVAPAYLTPFRRHYNVEVP